MILYIIFNLVNYKVYIGKTEKPLIIRWQNHLANARRGSRQYIHNAIRKYGEESFIILPLTSASTSKELSEKEIQMISDLDSTNLRWGYNLTKGGEGISGWKHRQESREKMRKSRLAYKQSPETIAKAAASNRGKKHTPEAIAKMIANRKPQIFTDETRYKMRIAKLGKKRPARSDEYRNNIRLSLLGHSVSIETRQKISESLKKRNQKSLVAGA